MSTLAHVAQFFRLKIRKPLVSAFGNRFIHCTAQVFQQSVFHGTSDHEGAGVHAACNIGPSASGFICPTNQPDTMNEIPTFQDALDAAYRFGA